MEQKKIWSKNSKKISDKLFGFHSKTIFILKETMRIRITLSQLKQVLKTQNIRYPLSFRAENFTDKELEAFSRLLQSKERG
jgi:hypothetical protein